MSQMYQVNTFTKRKVLYYLSNTYFLFNISKHQLLLPLNTLTMVC